MAPKRSTEALVAAGAVVSAARVLQKGFVARYVSRFATYAVRRGMRSRSRGWLYAGAAATGVRLLHRYVGRTEEVYRFKLGKGESVEIREVGRVKGRA
ncbi:MAG: hypothetical protein ACHQIG_00530 [Acidimicrobiia bacterium]